VERERRQFARFKPSSGAFLAFRPEFAKLGKIQDISLSGLGYGYTISEGLDSRPECPETCELDIFLSDDEFYLPKLPCRVVYDTRLADDQRHPGGESLKRRRCGMEFVDITAAQQEKLKVFLKNHTTQAI